MDFKLHFSFGHCSFSQSADAGCSSGYCLSFRYPIFPSKSWAGPAGEGSVSACLDQKTKHHTPNKTFFQCFLEASLSNECLLSS